MLKHILCAIDFSKDSINALQFAWDIAGRSGAELILFNAYDIPGIENLGEKEIDEAIRKIESSIENRLEALTQPLKKKKYKPVYTRYITTNVSAWNGIMFLIKNEKIDLLVMGTHGASGRIKELLLGSTTISLMEDAGCPVLAIPASYPFKAMKNIAYASDFLSGDIVALEWLTHLARLYKSKLKIIHLKTKKLSSKEIEIHREQIENRIDYPGISFDITIEDDFFKHLQSFIQGKNIHLISMVKRKPRNTLFDYFFHQDMVKKVVVQTAIPILTFNRSSIARIQARLKQMKA